MDCAFCNPDDIMAGLLFESDNFYVRAVVKGPLAPGHVMLIPKDHASCFGALPEELDREYAWNVEELSKIVEESFSKPILVEQGNHGQSVKHAHLHFLPSKTERYEFTEESFSALIPNEIKLTYGKSIGDIRKIFREEGEYVSIQGQRIYICHTKDHDGTFRVIRPFIAQLSGQTSLLDWRNIPDSEKERSRYWTEQTLEALRPK